MHDHTELHDAIGVIVDALAARTSHADQPAAEPLTREDLAAVIARVDRLGERLEELLAGTHAEMPPTPDGRPLYTVAALCDRLGLSDRVVRQMLTDGVIPSFRVGGARRVDPAAVDEYLTLRRADEDAGRWTPISAAG
jgi:excisionase family DNA binding protein